MSLGKTFTRSLAREVGEVNVLLAYILLHHYIRSKPNQLKQWQYDISAELKLGINQELMLVKVGYHILSKKDVGQ